MNTFETPGDVRRDKTMYRWMSVYVWDVCVDLLRLRDLDKVVRQYCLFSFTHLTQGSSKLVMQVRPYVCPYVCPPRPLNETECSPKPWRNSFFIASY